MPAFKLRLFGFAVLGSVGLVNVIDGLIDDRVLNIFYGVMIVISVIMLALITNTDRHHVDSLKGQIHMLTRQRDSYKEMSEDMKTTVDDLGAAQFRTQHEREME